MDDDRVEDLREEVWRFLGVEACWWAGPVGVELGRVVPGDGGHNQVVEDVQRGDRVEDILDEGQSGGVGPHHRGWVVSHQERRRIDPDQTRSRCRQGRTKHPSAQPTSSTMPTSKPASMLSPNLDTQTDTAAVVTALEQARMRNMPLKLLLSGVRQRRSHCCVR
jgi:hypothetical protein